MDRDQFKRFLETVVTKDGKHLTERAIAKRLVEAARAEVAVREAISLETIVRDDGLMLFALKYLRALPGKKQHDPMGNALRKYYQMVNGREFPRVRDLEV